jgi:hypothetical protein
MSITFSTKTDPNMESATLADLVLKATRAATHAKYNGNVYAEITWHSGRRVRFTLATRDAWAIGSRRAASGRHMRKASWEAHRDVLRYLFAVDPHASVRTALANYYGRGDFERKFPATAHKNVGSIAQPRTFRSCTV